ncbi:MULTISPECIES: hypothetical protein [unclassified Microcoleus]|uniref:hypothetical protein n=1 Tax=unclassified Microcoleus TaxID=2642155 RepID=UPI002FD6F503
MSVVSCQLSVVRCQLSVVSCQLSVVSCQLSVVSCQLSVVSCYHSTPSTVNSQQLTVNSQQSTVNSQQSTIPIPNSQGPIIDYIACGKTCGKVACRLWKTLLDRPKQLLHKNGRSTSTAFPQVFHRYLLPISKAQQAVSFFFHNFHRASNTKIIQ